MHPHDYPKRVLIAVSGLSPQILTETLYGLAVNSDPAFVPTEIHLITTQLGGHSAELNLLHGKKGHFHSLCNEYNLAGIQFDPQHIHVIQDDQGKPLADIRTPRQNEAAADFITGMVRQLTQTADSALHVSIAGGRKTMGYYVGYALSLFGRRQDRLSHVLVSEDYEGHPEFYYPTQESNLIHTRGDKPKPLDTSKAKVVLAEIPFIRMRQDIPSKLLEGKAGFLETINLTRRAELPAELVIDEKNKLLSASGEVFSLPDSQLAFYRWLLNRTVAQQTTLEKPRPSKYRTDYAEAFITIYQNIGGQAKDMDRTEKALEKGMGSQFFSDKINGVNKVLIDNLGHRLAAPYLIKKTKTRLTSEYYTELEPGQLHFQELDSNGEDHKCIP